MAFAAAAAGHFSNFSLASDDAQSGLLLLPTRGSYKPARHGLAVGQKSAELTSVPETGSPGHVSPLILLQYVGQVGALVYAYCLLNSEKAALAGAVDADRVAMARAASGETEG